MKTSTSCWQWSQFLQPPAPWTLVRSSSCAVGLCIYCSSKKACAGSSWLRLGYTDLGDAVHVGWGDSYCLIQLSSLTLRGTMLALNHGPDLCVCNSQVTEETLTNTPRPQGRTCSSVAPAATAPLLKIHTLSSRAHSFCVSLILPVVLPLMQVGFLLVFSIEEWPLKKIQLDLKCEQRIQAGSWGLGEWPQESVSSNQGPAADGTLSHSFWGECKLTWYQAVFMENCYVSEMARTRRPWSAGPGERCDIEFCSSLTLSLTSTTCLVGLSSHLSKLHKQVFVQKHLNHGHSCEKPLFR